MRSTLIRALVFSGALACAGVAVAADLPRSAPNSTYYQPAPAYNWSGFYVGINGGGGFATGSTNGIIGGVQAGYNWQAGNWVFGPELDFQLSSQHSSTTVSGGGVTVTETDRGPWFGTVRGRIGYAFDRLMVYGTGGLAYAKVTRSGVVSGLVNSAYSSSPTKTGYAVGGGFEHALGGNWSAKVEYLYIGLPGDTQNYLIGGVNVPVNYPSMHDHIVRAGLNYRF